MFKSFIIFEMATLIFVFLYSSLSFSYQHSRCEVFVEYRVLLVFLIKSLKAKAFNFYFKRNFKTVDFEKNKFKVFGSVLYAYVEKVNTDALHLSKPLFLVVNFTLKTMVLLVCLYHFRFNRNEGYCASWGL